MTRFNLVGQAALSAGAQREQGTEPAKFAAQQLEAETHLGVGALPDPLPTALEPIALLAVALQVTWQYERGINPLLRASEGSQSQASSVTYRDEVLIDPRALGLMNQVREGVGRGPSSGYAPIRSLRGGRPTPGVA